MSYFAMGGYVLAGGRSSRMGTDKALLRLGGRPLIERAVTKLRGLCGNVHILSSNSALAAYAPLLADLHPGCGPIGGIEAALSHSTYARNLFLSVDMPFLPQAFVRSWIDGWSGADGAALIHLFTSGGRPQPGFCLLHKDVLPFLSESIVAGEYKLMHAFHRAATGLAVELAVMPEELFLQHPIEAQDVPQSSRAVERNQEVDDDQDEDVQRVPSAAQLSARPLWFANLNTPEDFAEAEKNVLALND